MTHRMLQEFKVIGQRSRSPGRKVFSGLITVSRVMCSLSRVKWVLVKGHMGQGQANYMKPMTSAGGLMSTSSCFILI